MDNSKYLEKRRLLYALVFPLTFAIVCLLVWLVEWAFEASFATLGIAPHSVGSLTGIVTHVFVHANAGHLFGNMLSFLVLSVCLFYFYRDIAYRIFLLAWLLEGVLLWVFGREGWHVGASGLIYALAFFLFWSGVFRRNIRLIAISLLVVFLYGGFVWHVFPWKINDPISWEGHLSGLIVGTLLAALFRDEGPADEMHDWGEEEEENDEENDKNNEEETLKEIENETTLA